MRIGASTSNFYPSPTEDCLATLLSMGFHTVEVFLNSPSEAKSAFARQLRAQADAAGAQILSVHPYLSLAEPYCLFSLSERRFQDYLDDYREQFEAAAIMGASYLVLHGDRAAYPPLSPEGFAERYLKLYEAGQECGVTLLQENVIYFRAEKPEFVRQMQTMLGDRAQFVLDLKQCRRAGVPAIEMINAMGGALRHVHLSDADETHDCLMPGNGSVDFAPIFKALHAVGFEGTVMLELYRENFGEERELLRGKAALDALL